MITDIPLLVVIAGVVIVSSWLLKTKLRRTMEKGLRRKVADGELTSITAWMRVPKEDLPYPRDESPYI
jgi:sensor domain CHASE-containing protein